LPGSVPSPSAGVGCKVRGIVGAELEIALLARFPRIAGGRRLSAIPGTLERLVEVLGQLGGEYQPLLGAGVREGQP
jgi:hypothetical protein